MPDVRMPDGRIIRNVPEGTTQEELLRRLEIMDAQQQAAPTITNIPTGVPEAEIGFGRPFVRGLGRQSIDNLLGLLRTPPGLLARPSIGRRPPARAEDVFAAGDTLVQMAGRTNPALGPVVRPLPPPGELEARQAVAQSSPVEGPVAAFPANQAAQEAISQRFEAEAPGATALGEITGDVLSLIGGRAPLARAGAFNQVVGAGRAFRMAPGARRLLQRAAESDAVQFLARAGGRSLETGIEGLILAAVQDGDPLEMGAIAAGGQAVGSMLTPLVSTKGGALGLAATAAGYAALLQLAKQSTPGGRDRILESIETGFDKIILGAGAGLIAGLAGAGRVRGSVGGKLAQDLPLVADSLSAIPRGAVLSWVESQLQGGAEAREAESVVRRLSQNPNFFPPKARDALRQSMTAEDGDVSATVQRLKDKDPRFRRSLEKLMEDQEG